MWRMLLAGVLLLASGAFAGPSSLKDATPEIQAAVLRFFDGMQAGDAEVIVEAIWASPDSTAQHQQRQYFADLVAAQKSLERVAASQFGADARRLGSGFHLLITPADREAVKRSKVYLDDPYFARMEKEGETTHIRLRRGPRMEWQVVLDIVEIEPQDDGGWMMRRPDSMSRIRQDRLKGMGEAVEAVRRRVETRDLTTAAAAETDLLDRLNKVHQEAAKRRNALPERRYWRDVR